ncbi:MAG: M55 family metallopeptidase, partial [Acidobacteriota bacterium]|nr:M55 family metallopeptidase [Acidobacteriota bacterium]
MNAGTRMRDASLVAFLWLMLIGHVHGQQGGLKIYISADMEGVTGAVSSEQLGPSGFEYQRFRKFLTEEV